MSVIFGLVSLGCGRIDKSWLKKMISCAEMHNSRTLVLHEEASFCFGYPNFEGPNRFFKSEDKRFVVMMGGECFGRKEALNKLGCHDAPDYHVNPASFLWHLYRNYGTDGLRWLDGPFSMAVFDRFDEKLVLLKDPMGLHPLFVAQGEGVLAFSSEYQVLMGLKIIDKTLNYQAISELFAYGAMFGGRTPLNGLVNLPPGCEAKCDRNESVNITIYEDWKYVSDSKISIEEAADKVFSLMRERMIERLADGKVKELPLSGGFDTRFIIGLMPPSLRKEYHYYTHCSPYLAEYQDRDVIVARLVAEKMGLSHEIRRLNPEITDISEGSWFYENIRPVKESYNIQGHFSWFIRGWPPDFLGTTYWELDRIAEKKIRYYGSRDIKKWATSEMANYAKLLEDFRSDNAEWAHFCVNYCHHFMHIYGALNGGKWVNPVVFFLQNLRTPFADASLIRMLLTIPSNYINNGNLFIAIYGRHFPELLNIPFVENYLPKKNIYSNQIKVLETGTLYMTVRKRIWEKLFRHYLFSKLSWRRNLYGWRMGIALLFKWCFEYQLPQTNPIIGIQNHWRYKKLIPPRLEQTFVRLESWLREYGDEI